MKCNICKAELNPDNYYTFTRTFCTCDIVIMVCDACDRELMRMYRKLRKDIADHI